MTAAARADAVARALLAARAAWRASEGLFHLSTTSLAVSFPAAVESRST